MKRAILFSLFAILTISSTIFADVKIKIRQKMSGQETENTTYIKGKRQRTDVMNGQMVTITQCDLRRDVQLLPTAKSYTVSPFDDGTSTNQTVSSTQTKSVVSTKGGTLYITTTNKDTGERKQMFGYTARHIIQTIEMESSPDSCNPTKSKMIIDAWVIDETFGFQCDRTQDYQNYQRPQAGGCRDKVVPKTIGTAKNGYPLYQKMTFFDENGKETTSMIQEVTELSKATLDASLFEIPGDYREVKDFSSITNAANYSNDSSSNNSSSNQTTNLPKTNQTVSTEVGVKREGVVRIGVAQVKTGAVGEGMNANELSAAVQNTLADYLKGTKVELVQLEAKLPSTIAEEAKSKKCDFVLFANVSHKKGGGGFGKMLGKVGEVVSRQAIGSSDVGGQIARTTIVSAATATENVKSKDEISLDIKLQKSADNSSAFAKQYKGKAKSDGEDILSPMIEQIAQAILNTVSR